MYQRVGASAYKKDLTNTLALCKGLDNPERTYPTIHVAGTNGKGSVSSITASVLQAAGYKTGLYTSPHLKDFTERIRVDGQPIPQQAVVDFVSSYRHLVESVEPSFFEATVAMAFWWFKECKVDVAVIEVGMGGRLDSTNVILPVAGAVTNISMDHAQHLGETLPLIAAEKAGIFKKGISFVVGKRDVETEPVFLKAADSKGSSLAFAEDLYKCVPISQDLNGQTFQVSDLRTGGTLELFCDLPGWYQAENLSTALSLLDLVREAGFRVLPEHVSSGVAQVRMRTGLSGRMTLVGDSPKIMVDVGHNEAGIEMAMKQVLAIPHQKLHMVIGAVNDKDISSMLGLMPPQASYYFVKPDVPRGLDSEELLLQASKLGLKGKSYRTVLQGLDAAKSAAQHNDLIFVGGSTFVVAEALP
jgi:dihydrofolate synthase/folylpolyglutamate synthase